MKKYIKASTDNSILGDYYSQYYEVAEDPADVESDEEFDRELSHAMMQDYGIEFLGWAFAKPEYEDALSFNGIDIAAIGREDDEVDLYLVGLDPTWVDSIYNELERTIEDMDEDDEDW